MADPLEAEIDQLFQLPPGELTAARNALADRVRKAGDKAAAARIKAIKRPTPTAWALNQVHFRHAALLDRAREATQRLRELHALARDAHELQAAIEVQRAAMGAVIDAAVKCCQAAGVAADGPQQRKLFTTLQAWLAGSAGESPGRMTQDIEASGFDAVAALGMAAVRAAPVPSPQAPSPQPQPAAPDPQAIERASALLAERERHARAAAEEVERRRALEASSERDLEAAQRAVREAEAALLDLRAQVRDREAELARSHAAFEAARQNAQRADEAAAEARAALSALSRG